MKTKILYPLTIYFDGSCRLCRSEIENIATREVSHRLELVDCSARQFDASTFPYSQADMMSVISAQDAAGTWLRGVDVFIAAYKAANLHWVSNLLATKALKPLAELAYPWLVRNRYHISALGLHRALNFFTHRARNRQAHESLARTQLCANNACEARPANSTIKEQ
jgi:predicted DCC family thiol-disulfide oxidoreductase YuxK